MNQLFSQSHYSLYPACTGKGKNNATRMFFRRGLVIHLLTLLSILISATFIHAQDQLVGLASTGGPDGGGTVFSIQTNGTNFKIERAFSNSGATPNGDLIRLTDGNFYGMTSREGIYGNGTIFKMSPTGVVTVLRHLQPTDGTRPKGGLVRAPDGYFYGMTNAGGKYGYGTIFKISLTGVYTVLHDFNGTDGKNPTGSLFVSGSKLYGLTPFGGSSGNFGTWFSISLAGEFSLIETLYTYSPRPYGNLIKNAPGEFSGLASGEGAPSDDGGNGTIFTFNLTGSGHIRYLNPATEGYQPYGSLMKAKDGNYYCMTSKGGQYASGTILKVEGLEIASAWKITVVAHLDEFTTGGIPRGNLCEGADGNLYGMTSTGGNNGGGTIFKVNPSTGVITVIRHLKKAKDGAAPYGSLYFNSADGYFYGMTSERGTGTILSTGYSGTIFKINSTGSSYTVLNFLPDGNRGIHPQKSLVLAKNGNYYGTTLSGGKYGGGTVFRITPTGTFTVLNSFHPDTTGSSPRGTLMQASNGNFYGTTSRGGVNGYGTLFKMTAAGAITVLFHFSSPKGGYPEGKLLQGIDGNLYGTTRVGGTYHDGTVFKFTLSNNGYTVLHHFDGVTGSSPQGDLIQTSDGYIYGMTRSGSASGFGNIFRIYAPNPSEFTVLKTFTESTGHNPYGGLIQGSNGVLHGMTWGGGTGGFDAGTIFRFTISSKYYRVIHNFPAGSKPLGNLVEGSDGSFYGMTSAGGTYNAGTIFKIVTDVSFTTLYNFNPAKDGSTPLGSLIIKKDTVAIASITQTGQAAATETMKAPAGILYPNPVGSVLTVVFNQPLGQMNATVSNSLGEVIIRNKGNIGGPGSFKMNVEALRPGVYYLRLQTDKETVSLKFIKE